MANESSPIPNPVPTPAPESAAAKPPAAGTSASYLSFFPGQVRPDEIVVFHHSNLFYWWPVWFFGFIFAALTYFGDGHMAVVPPHTQAVKARTAVVDIDGKQETV